MTELDDQLAQQALQAIRSSAEPLGVDVLTLAKRLRDGEIYRSLRLLNAALPHVSAPSLRHRIEDLLSEVTDGRMPMFEKPETDLDWALQTIRRRREQAATDSEAAEEEGADGPAC
jgi:hypothetical protein